MTRAPSNSSSVPSSLRVATPLPNLKVGTDNTDINYQASFGYRFNRYIAGELGLAQYGKLESKARPISTSAMAMARSRLKSRTHSRWAARSSRCSASCPSTTSSRRTRVSATCSPARTARSARRSTARAASARMRGAIRSIRSMASALDTTSTPATRSVVNTTVLKDVGQQSRNGTENFNLISVGVVVRF